MDRADLRWGGSETGTVGYPCWSTFPYPFSHSNATDPFRDHNELQKHGDPEGKHWVPAMADFPLRNANGRHEWFWEPDDEQNLASLPELMDIYEKSVGRNATLIVGLTPDTEGVIPEGDVCRLKEWGEEISRRYNTPLNGTRGNNGLTLDFSRTQRVNACIIQENITQGERVRAYRIEAMMDGQWQTVCEGESVGHKRIERFDDVETNSIRLVVRDSIASPRLVRMDAFYIENERK